VERNRENIAEKRKAKYEEEGELTV